MMLLFQLKSSLIWLIWAPRKLTGTECRPHNHHKLVSASVSELYTFCVQANIVFAFDLLCTSDIWNLEYLPASVTCRKLCYLAYLWHLPEQNSPHRARGGSLVEGVLLSWTVRITTKPTLAHISNVWFTFQGRMFPLLNLQPMVPTCRPLSPCGARQREAEGWVEIQAAAEQSESQGASFRSVPCSSFFHFTFHQQWSTFYRSGDECLMFAKSLSAGRSQGCLECTHGHRSGDGRKWLGKLKCSLNSCCYTALFFLQSQTFSLSSFDNPVIK